MRKKKKVVRILLPVLVFLFGAAVLCQVVWSAHVSYREKAIAKAELNAVTYGSQMVEQLKTGVAITDTLEQIILATGGDMSNFSLVASRQMQSYIQSIQLAPEGIVTQVYPLIGNENARMDLFSGGLQTRICRYAQENNITAFQGPVTLSHGDKGIIIRNPVFLGARNDRKFWGFTIVVIRVPDIFESSVESLQNFGYHYRLSVATQPISQDYTPVDSSGVMLTDPVEYTMELGNCSWKLEVSPIGGWDSGSRCGLIAIVGGVIVILLTGLVASLEVLNDGRRRFRHMAATDALTGLLNRNGFDREVENYYREHPGENCVAGLLDIDDFKLVNDVYGHPTGDQVLRQLAQDLQKAFPENAILGRNGGDEFSFILKNTTEEAAEAKIQAFAAENRTFLYQKEPHSFGISLGYAGGQAEPDESTLLSRADMALYAVKLQGKHSAQAYSDHLDRKRRVQLGFALRDVTENLPGAFLIYKADPVDDSLLYASQEFIHLVRCKDFRGLMRFTEGHFENLIHPEDRARVLESIRQQLNAGTDESNDYVSFRCAAADGSYREVLDHGRLVDNPHYGKLFYVVLFDKALLERYT